MQSLLLRSRCSTVRSRIPKPQRRQPVFRTGFSEASPPLRKAAVPANLETAASSSSVSSPSFGRPFGAAWNAYCRTLDRSPLLTKASMAAVIFFGSDSATQYILQHNNNTSEDDTAFSYDSVRALSGASFGIIATTWLHYWWGFLEAVVGSRLPVAQYRLANTAVKVVIDQGVGAPLYIYSYYMLTNLGQRYFSPSTLSADDKESSAPSTSALVHDVHDKAANMLWPTMLQHWKLWPAVHSFNFYYTPLHHRVLVQNAVLVGWSGYLSHLNAGHIMSPDEEIHVAAAVVRRESMRRMEKEDGVVVETKKKRVTSVQNVSVVAATSPAESASSSSSPSSSSSSSKR